MPESAATARPETVIPNRDLLALSLIIFIGLFYFSPGFSTPLFYIQTDSLHFSKQGIGNLGVFSGGFSILAAVLYSQLINAGTTAIVLVLLPFLPAALMRSRDGTPISENLPGPA